MHGKLTASSLHPQCGAAQVSNMANEWIPLVLRASFTSLLMALYIDRFPQREQRLPETIHTLRDADGAVELADLALDRESAGLPRFKVSDTPSNKDQLSDPREHISHPDNMKVMVIALGTRPSAVVSRC
jgi:hypothetical protein